MTAEQKCKELYKGLGWPTIFTKIRFWTGSLVQIERYIPESGKILDLGCGYGIVANYLALCSGDRYIIGVEMNKRKIQFAHRGVSNTKFISEDATKIKIKDFRAILLLDVLHHLKSYRQGEKLIADCATMLKSGGELFILEIDNYSFWKWILCRIMDFVLYLNNPNVFYRYKNSMLNLLERHFEAKKIKTIKVKNNPFPHVLYICKKE